MSLDPALSSSYDEVKHHQGLDQFLLFLSEVSSLLLENTLKLILGSKSEKFEKIEARGKLGILVKQKHIA